MAATAALLLWPWLPPRVEAGPAAAPLRTLPALETKSFPQGTLYVFKVPACGPYRLAVAQNKTLAGIESAVWRTGAAKPLLIINGGFFDPNNQLTTSYIFQGGQLTGDPHMNPQLVGNARLAPYLPKIFGRTEFRIYHCDGPGGAVRTDYGIVARDDAVPAGCRLRDALGAGPLLLPAQQDLEEGFVDYDTKGRRIRDPIGVSARNARSAVGITANGDVLIAMGAQDPVQPSRTGFNLSELAALLKARGAVRAMALDGGSSSGFVYNGKAYYGKYNAEGIPVKRPVKSVLMVLPGQ